MSRCKYTNFFSEIGTFFQKSGDSALQAIANALQGIGLTDRSLGLSTKGNASRKTSEKLLALLLLPFFGCSDVSHLPGSALSALSRVGYNMLYRMERDPNIDWRKCMARLSKRVEKYLSARCAESDTGIRCLVADDTDIAKSGMKIEKIGRIFSHTQHRHIIGFKGLLLGITDGKTFRPLDSSLHGEAGRDGTQGLSAKQRKARKQTALADGTPAKARHDEYLRSKIAVLIEMVRRARRNGTEFEYLLVDSWFMCRELAQAVLRLSGGSHVLGMLKNNVNIFAVGGERLRSGQMVSRFRHQSRRCRKYRCEYIVVDTALGDIPVRLFLCRRSKSDGWKTILTTDTSLSFVRAYEIYAMRWSIEVCFKECKQYLRLEGNQAQHFNSQTASVSVCLMQYTLLNVVKRMTSYETLGGLFRDTKADVVEITLYERILLVLREILEEFTEYLGFPNKELVQRLLSDNDLLVKIQNSNCLRLCA